MPDAVQIMIGAVAIGFAIGSGFSSVALFAAAIGEADRRHSDKAWRFLIYGIICIPTAAFFVGIATIALRGVGAAE